VPPTESARFLAPVLLEPPNEAVFNENDDIVLSWQPVGQLPADVYYEVVVAWSHIEAKDQVYLDKAPWTKQTAWKLSERRYLFELSADGNFQWSVHVMQKTGESGGSEVGLELSPMSEVRKLVWKGSADPEYR
jgi:hypothetical protein